MSSQDARHFGKSLFHKLTNNQAQTEDLFEQIFLNNVHNIESRITDEEAQQRMSSEIINYTTSISEHFTSPKEKEMAQGIIPYIMLEYASNSNVELPGKSSIDEEKQQEQPNPNKPLKDSSQKFKENLERLKPYILENIARHWRPVAGAATIGGLTYAVTKFMLGCTAKRALLMGGGLGLAVFIGWEVYEHFAKGK